MSFEILFLIAATFFAGGVVKGVLGFGLPLITMSVLPFLIPIEQAILLSAMVQPFTNIFQLFSSGGVKRAIEISWPIILPLLPGVAVGAWYLASVDTDTLLIIIGVMIIVFATINLTGFAIEISPSGRIPAGFGLGFVAGVIGAMTALNSWAFITYLVGIRADRQEFRSGIALIFLVSGFLISSSLWVVGVVEARDLLLGFAGLVASVPGMLVGDQIGRRFSAERFRIILLYGLIVVGFVMIGRTVF